MDNDNQTGVEGQSTEEKRFRIEIELDWEALAVAFENQLPESHSFLSLKTGKIYTVVTDAKAVPEPPAPPEDYRYIHPRPSREGYRTMQHFVEVVADPLLREKLTSALVGKGAFRRFKDQLLGYPEVRQEWFTFKDADVYAYVRNWLEREGILPTNQPPSSSSKERLPLWSVRPVEHRRDLVSQPETWTEEDDWKKALVDYDRPRVWFRPGRTALLVIDMQKVFVHPEGDSFLPRSTSVSERLAGLVEVCRSSGVPVIFTRHVHQHPQQDGGALARWWRSLILEGTQGSELADPFKPRENERMITKCRYSAFAGTPLEMILHSMGAEDLLIGGVMTNLCCETTARDAFVRDFNVFFLGDGTTTTDMALHLSTLRNIAFGFGRVLSVNEAIEVLRGGHPRNDIEK